MSDMYITTKQQCQSDIDKRMPIVCRGCGGKIEPIETVDNAHNPTFWMGCVDCQCIDTGTTPNIYSTSTSMVDDKRFRAYSHDRQPDKETESEDYKYWRKSQIRGTVSIVTDILRIHGVI